MNNFKEYGFEADFEGEILKEVNGYYIGWAKIEGYEINACKWNKKGITKLEWYKIKPIKKEWYENPDNFPCVVLDRNYNMYLAKGISMDKFLTQEFNRQIGYAEHFRPATKDEVLSLLAKE